ncbi:sulfatase [Reichenbachiella carrageenanivorans]|uniref:Sulfatase n=1 Tax=Reichenbachiella carrageenanivorans TaxID=2979869 RepID=A0ABY6D1M6_9BACT|nr:sulfatase [Reichenbachiella carrageenanivorans]UXX79824.1 sulfatase [Reichenbachiella carrageenanivorans]
MKTNTTNPIIKRRTGLLVLSLLILLGAPLQAQNKQKPNIVFFLVDDMGWNDVSYAQSQFYETPNIDKASKEGVVFSQAYAAHPRCVPSRYAMVTGRYPARVNSPGPGEGDLTDDTMTLAEPFKAAGYATFFAGKWHLASAESYPNTQGFDYNFGGGHAGAPKSYFQPYNVQKSGKGNGKERNIKNLGDAPVGYYLTDHLTDKTVTFIREHKDEPFLVYLSHYGVHTPFESKDEKTKAYRKKARSLYGDAEVEEFALTPTTGETKLRQDNAVYAGMIESMDESFGRVMGLLEELDLKDNTIVVFTSDHGGLSNRGNGRKVATSNLPLKAGKGHNYEGGVRVPMFVSWPSQIQPGSSSTVITGTDYFPTLLELSGLPLENKAHIDGVSFAPSLTQNKLQNTDRPVFWHSPLPRPKSTGDLTNTAVRLGDYKLLDFYQDGRIELYNIAKDQEESNNLADSMPEKRDELMTLVNDWRKEVNAYMGKK